MKHTTQPRLAPHLVTAFCAAFILTSQADARPKLESTCPGGIPIDFVRACDAHADKGYVPLRRKLSDGSCMNMCCQQDANGNISCTSDPNLIRSRSGAAAAGLQPGSSTLAPPVKTPPAKMPAAASPGVLSNSK